MTFASHPLFAAVCLLTMLAAPVDARNYAGKARQSMFKPDTERTALWR